MLWHEYDSLLKPDGSPEFIRSDKHYEAEPLTATYRRRVSRDFRLQLQSKSFYCDVLRLGDVIRGIGDSKALVTGDNTRQLRKS